MQTLLNKSIELAVTVHKDQKDKGGNPYILHPLRVMVSLGTIEEQIVGVLHDVIEDLPYCAVPLLIDIGLPLHLLEAVQALTKIRGESYDDYLSRVAANAIALNVKKADLTDNMDLSRITAPTLPDYYRLEKYRKAYKFLSEINLTKDKHTV